MTERTLIIEFADGTTSVTEYSTDADLILAAQIAVTLGATVAWKAKDGVHWIS